jgi:hypothetical protein
MMDDKTKKNIETIMSVDDYQLKTIDAISIATGLSEGQIRAARKIMIEDGSIQPIKRMIRKKAMYIAELASKISGWERIGNKTLAASIGVSAKTLAQAFMLLGIDRSKAVDLVSTTSDIVCFCGRCKTVQSLECYSIEVTGRPPLNESLAYSHLINSNGGC